VTAPRIERKEPRDEFWLNRGASMTLRREDFEGQKSKLYAYELLEGIAGIAILRDQLGNATGIAIRGYGSDVFFVDGVGFTDFEDISNLTTDMIESIDILKGVIGGAMLGVRGANGAISITTRKGGEDGRKPLNYTVFTPLGYQKPVEFYSPTYETLEDKNLNIPDFRTTIFWKPDVVIFDAGEAGFEFYTSDFSTTYSVVIEGLTTDGRIIRQVEKIRVE